MRLLLIRTDGTVVPCCGTGTEACGLVIGNAFNEKIDEIILRANLSPLLNSLALYGGPYELLNVLKLNGRQLPFNDLFTSTCEACYKIFSNSPILEYLTEHFKDKAFEMYARRLGWQTKLIKSLKNGSIKIIQ